MNALLRADTKKLIYFNFNNKNNYTTRQVKKPVRESMFRHYPEPIESDNKNALVDNETDNSKSERRHKFFLQKCNFFRF
jgi:hypothetical protein